MQAQNVPNSGNFAFWRLGGNSGSAGQGSTVFGTISPLGQPIFIYTAGIYRAQFTTGAILNNPYNPPATYNGDGLRIVDATFPLTGTGRLDLWTGSSNTTHIQFGASGNIDGQFTRFEVSGHNDGLWLNAKSQPGYQPRIWFNINGNEVGRFNPAISSGFMRVGANPANVDAVRRLEVYDNANAPQFRITQSAASVYTDFQTTLSGDLVITAFNTTLLTASDRPRNVGIETATPGNTLEINYRDGFFNAASLNGYTATSSGFSGLRFTDLKYGTSVAATPLTNLGPQGVLSVDANGDLMYIEATTGFGTCGAPSVLAGDANMSLNAHTLYFSDNQLASRIEIGGPLPCPAVLPAKLIVRQSSGADGTMGIHVTNTDQSITRAVYGVFSQVLPTTPNFNDLKYVGGFFHAKASKECVGVEGLADGLASNAVANYGGKFTAFNGGANYGIYAQVANVPLAYAGWFEGDVYVNGGANSGTGFLIASDQSIKTNIDSITDALALVGQLKPRSFFFDSTIHPQMRLSNRKQYGLIAQDVETILPELVSEAHFPAQYDTLGNQTSAAFAYKTLNYNAFIAILLKGMQEQQDQIDRLSDAVDALQSQMNSCCQANARSANTSSQTDVHLSSAESIVLNQNVPNPFAEQTTITYQLPENVTKAQLLFYDAQGKLIKAVELQSRGEGQVNVFADDLSDGIYSYALVADGKVIDTRRMVKSK